jgi:hypothetical protein
MPRPRTPSAAEGNIGDEGADQKGDREGDQHMMEGVPGDCRRAFDPMPMIASHGIPPAGVSPDRPPMSGPGSMLVQGWSGRHAARAGTNTSGAGACSRGPLRPDGIVMPAPALDDDLRLAESVEDLAVGSRRVRTAEQARRCRR